MAAAGASRATLPRGERLRDRRELQRLFRRGSRVERPSFVLLWTPIPGRRAAAFTAGRKLGGSVWRNRARRRLREAYRRQATLLPGTGLRLCFVARPRVVAVSFAELSSEVAEALRHAARRLAS
jgi:ribonuclease P protein component